KFQLVRDGDYFYALVNENTATAANVNSGFDQDQRNRVTLVRGSAADLSSPDFASILTIIDEADVQAKSDKTAAESVEFHGFQYPSFVIEDGEVVALYRVSWGLRTNYHDANFIGCASFDLP